MFATGFQSNAFQTSGVFGLATGGNGTYSYHPEYQRALQKQNIRRDKTELQKVVSVISEYQRKEAIVAESTKLASQKERARLLKLQNELITEINRLLMVKAEMMARIKRQEEHLILMVALKRKRFRAFNLTEIRI